MRWSVLIVLVAACGGDDGTVACTPADHEYIDGCNLYDCTGSDACDGVGGAGATCGTLDCSHDAQCRLDCGSSPDCRFQPCVGMTTQCANNVQVCNRACP